MYDELIVPLVRRMVHLKKLTLYLQINHSQSFQIIPNQLTIKAIWAIKNSAFPPLEYVQ